MALTRRWCLVCKEWWEDNGGIEIGPDKEIERPCDRHTEAEIAAAKDDEKEMQVEE